MANEPANHDVDADVVVVGGGIGGLATAVSLADTCDVLVLESRERLGGRAHSVVRDAGAFDLGPSWFWANEVRINRLVRELGIRTHAQHIAGDAVYQDARRVQRLDGNPIDVPASRFSDGVATLVTALASRLAPATIRLGATVRSVRADRSGVTIEYEAITDAVTTIASVIRARHVVIALPPALAAHRIDFGTSIEDDQLAFAAITPVWMGAVAKVVATYDRPFWREDGLAGAAISHVGPMRELHDLSGLDGSPAALFGFVPLTHGTVLATRDQLVDQLATLFGPAAGQPEELLIADWRAEPNTSPPGTERLAAYQTFGDRRFQQPWGSGRVHWASTETSPVAPGHIEGALAAAERAAAAVTADASTPDR